METPTSLRPDVATPPSRIVVVSPDAHRGGELEFAMRSVSHWNVSLLNGGVQQVPTALGRTDPDVMVLDAPGNANEVLAPLQRVMQIYPAMQVVMLSDDHSAELLRAAMRIGVRDVLPRDTDLPSLLGTVRQLREQRRADAPREGRVLAFMPCKGGGGSTFVATNTAYALAEGGQRVLLLDLDLQWGAAELYITDRKPSTTLSTLAAQIDRVDATFLASSLVQVHPNLGVLAAPDDPVHAMDIRPEHIDVLMHLAKANYDIVIVDAGPSLDAVTVRAFDYADMIFPVLQLNLPTVRDTRRLLRAFRSLGYPADKIKPIVNRHAKGAPVRIEDLERTIGTPVFKTLPNDYTAASNSVNQGVPVIQLAGNSAIAQGIRELAGLFAAAEAEQQGGWFKRMLRRS
jgi:pilus assembly protein CpaE